MEANAFIQPRKQKQWLEEAEAGSVLKYPGTYHMVPAKVPQIDFTN